MLHHPVQQALHVPDPLGNGSSSRDKTMHELGPAGPIAMTPLGIGHQYFVGKTTGRGRKSHEPTPHRLFRDVALPGQGFLTVILVPIGSGIGMQAEPVMPVGAEKEWKRPILPGDPGDKQVERDGDPGFGFNRAQAAIMRLSNLHRRPFGHLGAERGQLPAHAFQSRHPHKGCTGLNLPVGDILTSLEGMTLFPLLDPFQILPCLLRIIDEWFALFPARHKASGQYAHPQKHSHRCTAPKQPLPSKGNYFPVLLSPWSLVRSDW